MVVTHSNLHAVGSRAVKSATHASLLTSTKNYDGIPYNRALASPLTLKCASSETKSGGTQGNASLEQFDSGFALPEMRWCPWLNFVQYQPAMFWNAKDQVGGTFKIDVESG